MSCCLWFSWKHFWLLYFFRLLLAHHIVQLFDGLLLYLLRTSERDRCQDLWLPLVFRLDYLRVVSRVFRQRLLSLDHAARAIIRIWAVIYVAQFSVILLLFSVSRQKLGGTEYTPLRILPTIDAWFDIVDKLPWRLLVLFARRELTNDGVTLAVFDRIWHSSWTHNFNLLV